MLANLIQFKTDLSLEFSVFFISKAKNANNYATNCQSGYGGLRIQSKNIFVSLKTISSVQFCLFCTFFHSKLGGL